MGRLAVLFIPSLIVLVLVVACGDDDDDGDDSGDQTAEATTAPANGDGDDDGGDRAGGGASIELSGDVSGPMELSGMSCDFFENAEGEADDQYNISITGDAEGAGYTIDVSYQPGQDAAVVSMAGGEPFGRWQGEDASVSASEDGGEIEATLGPAGTDPGGASGEVTVSGTWTCS
jgi:hypothetical protein